MKKNILHIKSRVIRKYHHIIDTRSLKDNLRLKNIHSGKRCFIMGNGPSLKDQDLTKLKNEWTFVVNSFYLHPQYDLIHPKFYAIFDSRYFIGDSESLRYLQEVSGRVHEDTVMIFPLKSKRLIEKNNIFLKNKKIYMYAKGFLDENYSGVIELHKTIPTPMSVSVTCLMVAIYMGFDPIYLMGLEHDWLAHKSNPNVRVDAPHFYDNKENQYFINDSAVNTYELNCWCSYLLFKNYRLLKKGTDSKIYNLTPNSFLDVFPFKKFEEVV